MTTETVEKQSDQSLTVASWPVWELVNPSDHYTFRAPNVEVAGVVACMLSPAYGAKLVGGDERSPLIIGWNEWMAAYNIDEQWIDDHAREFAEAYDSFLIGEPDSRAEAEAALALLPDEHARRRWKLERQDRLRTSVSAIGESAYSFAAQFRKIATERPLEATAIPEGGD